MKAIDNLKEKINNLPPISNKGAVWVVVGIHLLILAGISSGSSPNKTKPSPTPQELDKAFLETPEGTYTGIPEPTPTPPPLKQEILSDGKVATYPRPIVEYHPEPTKKVNSKYTQTYTIKKGDTLYSIAKKYKLSFKKLIELNNITNPNNIKEGQVLKFL